jgi:hypothetical protein
MTEQFLPPLRPATIAPAGPPTESNWVGSVIPRPYVSLLWADLKHAHLQDNPRRHVTDTGTKWVTNVLCFF